MRVVVGGGGRVATAGAGESYLLTIDANIYQRYFPHCIF